MNCDLLLGSLVNQKAVNVSCCRRYNNQRLRTRCCRISEMQHVTGSAGHSVTVKSARLPRCGTCSKFQRSSNDLFLPALPNACLYAIPKCQPHFSPKRQYISFSDRLTGSIANFEEANAYAGAKFAVSPPPDILPLPPLHWLMGLPSS